MGFGMRPSLSDPTVIAAAAAAVAAVARLIITLTRR